MAALAITRQTQTTWAKANGITQGHLSQVLSGRESRKLTALIDAFAQKHLPPAA